MTDFEKERFIFYKEAYYFELERKDKLLQQVGLALGILTIIGNLIAHMLRDFRLMPFEQADLLFYFFFGFGISFTAVSMYYISRTLIHRFYYGAIPSPQDIETTLSKCKAYNTKVDAQQQIDLEREYHDNLIRQFCEYTHKNKIANMERYAHVFLGLRFALVGLVLLVFAFPGHHQLSQRFPSKSAPISINDEIKIRIMPEENTQNERPEPEAAQPTAEPIERPQWPQGYLQKEADEKDTERRVINEQQDD